MIKPEPLIINGYYVFAAYHVKETFRARKEERIEPDEFIFVSLIIFADSLAMADMVLVCMGYVPECEVCAYMEVRQDPPLSPLIRSVTKDRKSFPFYFNN